VKAQPELCATIYTINDAEYFAKSRLDIVGNLM
jgi:hypothetical protein